MITTVTMNPCIDKSITVAEFKYGRLNRVLSSRSDIGGKGINVATAYKKLGGEVFCTGINYKIDGDFITDKLDEMNIPHDFVIVSGKLRENLKIVDQSNGYITEINETGYLSSEKSIKELKEKVHILSKRSSLMVFSGSVPKGIESDIYKELINECDQHTCKIILDAEGMLLLEGLKAKPYLIKPNKFELENALGSELNSLKELVSGARKLLNFGIQIICVSLGKDGAIILNKDHVYYAPPLPVEVKSTVGAGDSMVAALCLAIERKQPLNQMLRMAVAAAAATIQLEGTQMCNKQNFDALLPYVKITELSFN